MTDDLHVVLGTGPVGTAVAESVGRRYPEASIRLVDRSGEADVPPDVEYRHGDLSDETTARMLCEDAAVVYFCVQPPYSEWPAKFPPLLAGAIAGASAADATLVAAENLYTYGRVDGPMTEDLPADPVGPKGETRAEMTQTLFAAHESGEIRATVGRASDFYGPGVTESVVGDRVFEPAVAGDPVYLIGDLNAPHTYTYVGDFADALVTLGTDDRALGEVWHVPSAETLTTREFVECVFEVAETESRLRRVPTWLFRAVAQFRPTLKEVRETFYQFDAPFVADHSKFAETFGADPTPHREAISETLAWYRDREA